MPYNAEELAFMESYRARKAQTRADALEEAATYCDMEAASFGDGNIIEHEEFVMRAIARKLAKRIRSAITKEP